MRQSQTNKLTQDTIKEYTAKGYIVLRINGGRRGNFWNYTGYWPNNISMYLPTEITQEVVNIVSKNFHGGIPDLIAIGPAEEIIFIEIKRDKDRMSKLQSFFRDVVIKMGFLYEVVK